MKLTVQQIQENERKRAAQKVVNLFLSFRKTRSYPGYRHLAELAREITKPGIGGGWGGDFPYFSDVDDAAYEIGEFCRKWGRISVEQTKEKYGTARVYCSFGLVDLHGLLYPGYVHIKGNYRLMTFPFFAPLSFLINPWQRFIYRLSYKRALKKYPYIRKEILCVADYDGYLKGL